jgi:hypothetical protein
VPAAGARTAALPRSTQATFFQVPILSTRVLFILDLSGSMRDPSPEGPLTKLDVAKRGMVETVRALPPETRFGFLGLGCDAMGRYAERERKTWQGKLVLLPAAPPVKADAERYIRRLQASGWTNLYDAIEYAFTQPDADTIYLYTDGGASKGAFVATGEILSELRKMNRFRRIAIHTVEVPGARNTPDNQRLLEEIARATGGTSRLHPAK